MATIGTDIEKARELLKKGELVAIPTETVYGLAANAFDPEAITRVFSTKNRPSFDPLIVHTHHLDNVKELVKYIPKKALILAEKLWPGPLTLLLPKKDSIPDLATSGLDTVAIRIPQQALTLTLLKSLDFPLVAPSANPFGYVSPTEAQHVEDQLGDKIGYILNGGSCAIGIESTIVGFEGNKTIIYRHGGVDKERIESLIGKVKTKPHSTSNPTAPGMLENHYAPGKKLVVGNLEALAAQYSHQAVGIIAYDTPIKAPNVIKQIVLAPDGKLETAARHLFSALRILDKTTIDIILAAPAPNHGLGIAINDRLKRAASQ